MANKTGRKIGKKNSILGGNRPGMNYYANILSMHQMFRQIHALKQVLDTNAMFDR